MKFRETLQQINQLSSDLHVLTNEISMLQQIIDHSESISDNSARRERLSQKYTKRYELIRELIRLTNLQNKALHELQTTN